LRVHDDSPRGRLTAGHVERLLVLLETDHDAALVTLDGGSGMFCAGLDLAELVRHDVALSALLGRYAMLLHAIASTPRPVVALVGGAAMGGGVGLAAAADVVLATPGASFALPETLFGLVPAMALPMIARRVGPVRARRLAMTGMTITAEEACRIGLVDEVIDDLEIALTRYARTFERLDTRAIAEVKAMSGVHETTPDAYQEHASSAFARLAASRETQERIARFLAGDTPWPDTGDA
jgi:enoyl-CoA hydratase/carnithine racemase